MPVEIAENEDNFKQLEESLSYLLLFSNAHIAKLNTVIVQQQFAIQ